jgi:hypothetical protein
MKGSIMNTNQKITMIVGSGIAIIGITQMMKEHRRQVEQRKQIKAEAIAEIKRILRARDIVLERINSGFYQDTLSIPTIMTDLQFQRIIADEE